MVKRLVVYGAGYPDVVKLVDRINAVESQWEIEGFIDDLPENQESTFMGYPVLGNAEIMGRLVTTGTWFFNNVYRTTSARAKITLRLTAAECKLATLVDPSVDLKYTQIGEGTIINKGVGLGANVKIGKNCAVRYNSIINHDNVVEDGVFVGPGVTLSGHVTIREGAFLGAGSTILEHLEVGPHSVVAAGSVVLKNVAPGARVAGVPAEPI